MAEQIGRTEREREREGLKNDDERVTRISYLSSIRPVWCNRDEIRE
jgi:hypothetical protein